MTEHVHWPGWATSVSICLNNLTGGPRGWSLCARFWDARLGGSRAGAIAVAVTDQVLFFDPQHCRKAWLLRVSK